MRILGIDPGYDRAGVAVVEGPVGKERVIFSTCLTSSRGESDLMRARTIVVGVGEILERFSPSEAAIELLYFGKNQKTAMAVAEIRGALKSLCVEKGLRVFEYSPSQVKVAVTGSGRAEKKQVMTMVNRLVSLPTKPTYDDEYDAIAVALTHHASRRGAYPVR